jgi:hypothetical protein
VRILYSNKVPEYTKFLRYLIKLSGAGVGAGTEAAIQICGSAEPELEGA